MSDVKFWAGCPDVQRDPEKLHGEPTVGPYRVAVRTVVEAEELGQSPEETADEYGLPLDKVRAILGYYHAHQSELTSSR